MEELIEFLKEEFPNGIQMFDTRNIAGDYMETIYEKDGITVDYAPFYEYIEIFGLSKEEFEMVGKECDD